MPGVFSCPPPTPLPALTVGGRGLLLGPLLLSRPLKCQAQVVRRMHGARNGSELETTVIRAVTTGKGLREEARKGELWGSRTMRGCSSEHYSLLTFHLRVLQKWPMRSRLYAGGLGCSGPDATTATSLGQRTKEAEAKSQVPGEADALLPTSSW